MDLLADTAFLIDLWREAKVPGPATAFARANPDRQAAICWVVQGEFLSGAILAEHDANAISSFLAAYPVIHSTPDIARRYATLFAALRKLNKLIGPNDLWIAACALSFDLPLATRNTNEFSRIPNLKLIDYAHSTR